VVGVDDVVDKGVVNERDVNGNEAITPPLQFSTGAFPTIMEIIDGSLTPFGPLELVRIYCPGVKLSGTSQMKLPAFGTLSDKNEVSSPFINLQEFD